jgi:DNA-directed RNA polymerase subunit alpha
MKYIKSSIKESGNIVGHFILTKLNTGQGLTIGNALRRVLLSNIEGTAITALRIPNASHEFSTIPGIREDILEIVLNLKQVVLKTQIKNKISGKIYAQGPGILTASCIQFDDNVEIINPNQYIGTLTMNQKVEFDILLDCGVGYNFGEQVEQRYNNFFNIDAIFMPVINVNFKINSVYLSYNKTAESLALEITTNGSITPEKALREASQQLSNWFGLLINEEPLNAANRSAANKISDVKLMSIDELNLSNRAYNCLKHSGIRNVSDLFKYSREEFKGMKSFGKKSANEIFNVFKKQYRIIIPSLNY